METLPKPINNYNLDNTNSAESGKNTYSESINHPIKDVHSIWDIEIVMLFVLK